MTGCQIYFFSIQKDNDFFKFIKYYFKSILKLVYLHNLAKISMISIILLKHIFFQILAQINPPLLPQNRIPVLKNNNSRRELFMNFVIWMFFVSNSFQIMFKISCRLNSNNSFDIKWTNLFMCTNFTIIIYASSNINLTHYCP